MKKLYHNFIAPTPAKYKQIQLVCMAMLVATPAFIESIPEVWIPLDIKQFVVGAFNWILVGITTWAGTKTDKIEDNEEITNCIPTSNGMRTNKEIGDGC